MKKIRKGKVILVIFILLIIIIIGIFSVVLVNKKNNEKEEEQKENEEEVEVFELPETTYSEMKVANIKMEYLQETNETMVSMIIQNTSKNKVEKENLDAILLNKDGKILGQTQTYIESLEIGEEYSISVILKGDLTSTSNIKLQKKIDKTSNDIKTNDNKKE